MNRRQLLKGLAGLPVAAAAVALAPNDGVALTSMEHPSGPWLSEEAIENACREHLASYHFREVGYELVDGRWRYYNRIVPFENVYEPATWGDT